MSTWHLILTALRQKRVAIISYCVAGLALIGLYVAIYPSLASQIDSYNEIVKSIPPALMKVFGAANMSATNFEGVVGTKVYGLTWPLIAMFLTVSLAGSALAGEIERGTLGLWLAAPVSRLRIYAAKYAAAVLAVLAFVATSVTIVLPLCAAAGISVDAGHIWALTAAAIGLSLAVLSLTFLLSAVLSDKGRVYVIASAILLGMYVAGVVALLVDQLDWLKYLSFFYYYGADDILTGKSLNSTGLAVFAAVTLVCTALGAYVFRRRDISL